MCNAISGIMRSDGTTFFPRMDAWNHSHTAIAKENGIPDGEMGDRYARFEITPADGDFRSDQTSWVFKLDETRQPAWWSEDAPALEDKARRDALRWFRSFPDNLVPGFKCIGGKGSTLMGGDGSTLMGGYKSTLAWRYWDGNRFRTVVRYTGEDGIEAGKKYVFRNWNVVQADGGEA